MSFWAIAVKFLYDWQTLITGVMALGAATVALGPVKKQLSLMRAQNNVMVRDTIGHMILQLDAHRDRVHEITAKRLNDIHSSIHYFDHNGIPSGIGEWASQQQGEFSGVATELKALFVTSQDIEAIEGVKAAVLITIDRLTGVLWDIHAPDYAFMFPEDCNWTEEEETAAAVRSGEAQGELDDAASAVSASIRQLNTAYAEQRAALVRRLRIIDDRLLI